MTKQSSKIRFMLSVGQLSSAHAGYYLGLAREDYYTQGGEPSGQWFGKGVSALGLAQIVEPSELYNLFRGYSPNGTIPLVQLQKDAEKAEHRPGWDFCFSAPKSVSTIWSQSDASKRRLIQDAHEHAVHAALTFIESEGVRTRRGKGGHRIEATGMVAACFEHSTSRALDPQLHTHALIMNVGVRDDGTTGTLSGTHLFAPNFKMAAGALYRAELAFRLQGLGLKIDRSDGLFEVIGVSQELMNEFSKRRKDIEAELTRMGMQSAKAAAVATLFTRDSKESVSREKLFEAWREVGQQFGWNQDVAHGLFSPAAEVKARQPQVIDGIREASSRLTEGKAHFSWLDYVRALAEEAPGRCLDAETILEATTQHLAESPEIVRLGNLRGTARFTTTEVFALEQRLLRDTEKLHADQRHRTEVEVVMRMLATHPELSEDQMKALWHLTADTNGLAIVSGYAGSGKTHMLKIAGEIWQEQGLMVIGTAIAGRAQRELNERAGFPCWTVAKLTAELKKGNRPIPEGGVLVIDEAGMVATRQWDILTRASLEAGAKICAIGHEKQIQPIGPGAPFAEFGDRFGRSEVVLNLRQREQWAKEAVKDIADGKARQAISAFAERGLISVHDSKSEAVSALIRQWQEDGMDFQHSLILAGKRSDVALLNALAQEQMARAGKLGTNSVTVADSQFYVGDAVMFTKTSFPRQVENGLRGTVIDVNDNENCLRVRTADGRLLTINVAEFPHLSLGYAMTTHKAQGASTDIGYILAGGSMQDKELSYVQASRAKNTTRFYLTPADCGDALAEFSRQMERSRQKDMAISVTRQDQVQQQELNPSFD